MIEKRHPEPLLVGTRRAHPPAASSPGPESCSSESANSTSKITVAPDYNLAVRVIFCITDFSDPITFKWYDTHSIQRVRTFEWCNVPALRVENQSLIERGDDYCCFRGDLSRNLTCFSLH